MFGFILDFFKRETKEAFKRGMADAQEFLDNNPSEKEIYEYFNSVYHDSSRGEDHNGYSRGVVAVLARHPCP